MKPDLHRLREIVREAAAVEAVSAFNQSRREVKWDGSVVTELDRRIQARLEGALRGRWPGIPLLGEEMAPAAQRRLLAAAEAGLWCLDPLDGTSNFASGLPFFSISLAYLEGGRTVLGLVYDPERDECFMAEAGAGAMLNDTPLRPPPPIELKRSIACVDFKRLPGHLADQLAHAFPYMSQRNLGSSCLDWCWVAMGRFQVYIHGGQKFWDYAAGELILREAGGRACTLGGEPVFRVGLEPRSVVAATRPELFQEWWRWVEANR